MNKILTIALILLVSLSAYSQKSGTKSQGSVSNQETSKSKSSSKIYERSGKDIVVSLIDRLNSPMNEYYIAPYKDGIVYSVIKSSGSPTKQSDVEFYFAKSKDGKFNNPAKFELNNTGTSIPLAVSFDKSEQQAYITCIEPAPHSSGHYHIYNATLKDGKWSNWTELAFSKEMGSAGFPVMNSSSNTIYFSGKDKSGTDGYDLYSVTKSKDGWVNPKKLGSDINTSKDEIMPTLYNNTLFFASNGKGLKGKFELFLFDLSAKETESYKLDGNFNTADNNTLIVLLKDNRNGYLVNDHKQNSKGDFYSYKVNGSAGFIN